MSTEPDKSSLAAASPSGDLRVPAPGGPVRLAARNQDSDARSAEIITAGAYDGIE